MTSSHLFSEGSSGSTRRNLAPWRARSPGAGRGGRSSQDPRQHATLKTDDGRTRVVRHGHLPEREVMTGIDAAAACARPAGCYADDTARIRFSPSILPPYMRRSRSIETLLPILYLKGISWGDSLEALGALLGKDASGH
jgi:putative transposase